MKSRFQVKEELARLQTELEQAAQADDRHAQYILSAKVSMLEWVLNEK